MLVKMKIYETNGKKPVEEYTALGGSWLQTEVAVIQTSADD